MKIFSKIPALIGFSILLLLMGCSKSASEPVKDNVQIKAPDDKSNISVLSFRFPATEHYTNIMKGLEVDNLDVKIEMKGYEEYRQQFLLILSGKSASPYDIVYTNNELFDQAKANDWLLPLDEYVEKYWDKYNLGDIPEETWERVKHNGKIYGIPFQQNLQHVFYRKDIFEKYDLAPPTTYDDMLEVAEVLKEKDDTDYPLALTLEKPTGLFTEFNNALMAYGGEWFDENNRPLFNSPEGIEALDTLKKLFEYMPSGAVAYTNDDVMVALQQSQIAMTSIWTTRAAAMEDPDISQVIGKIAYAPAVTSKEGGIPASQFAQDAFVIPKNINADPDMVAQVIFEATDEESMIPAAKEGIPVRTSVLTNPEVLDESVQLEAARKTVEMGAVPLVDKPFMNIVVEKLGYYIGEVLTDNLSSEEALKKASDEVEKELKSQNYIK